jgi:hypothetical protein
MIDRQYNRKTDDSIMRQHSKIIPMRQGLFNLKAVFVDGWFALGNLLLLLGGNDSVEIGMKFRSRKVLDKSAISLLSGKNNGGQNA